LYNVYKITTTVYRICSDVPLYLYDRPLLHIVFWHICVYNIQYSYVIITTGAQYSIVIELIIIIYYFFNYYIILLLKKKNKYLII